MALWRTGFDPLVHGFRFVNYYDFSLEFDLPLVGSVDLGNIVYGLCGGMCYAAADYFHAEIPPPTLVDVPKPGSRLFGYLWERQLVSLSMPSVPMKIFEWMLRDNESVASLTAGRELNKVRSRIEAMRPAVLLLIRAGGFVDPTQNHQVLAVGYDLDEAAQQATLFLYDPNYPGEAPTLTLDLADPSQGIGGQHSTGETSRGFFVLNYRPRKRGLPEIP